MTTHFEFMIEEPSMEAFLSEFLPRILENRATYSLHTHQGKGDLLRKLESRLRAYSKWIEGNIRIFVVVDRDDDDCVALKNKLEKISFNAGLKSKSVAGAQPWQIVNRIVIEELEAWFFGEWECVTQAYPKISANIVKKIGFRLSDEVTGGTWEALERIFKKAGYFSEGLRKVDCARTLGSILNPNSCVSPSFACFYNAIIDSLPPIKATPTQ